MIITKVPGIVCHRLALLLPKLSRNDAWAVQERAVTEQSASAMPVQLMITQNARLISHRPTIRNETNFRIRQLITYQVLCVFQLLFAVAI